MISDVAIISLHKERRKRQTAALQVGELITRIYNGDHHVVLPELERNERVSTANLIKEGIEQYAMRVSSVLPTLMFPPGRESRLAKKRADEKRLTVLGWWHENKLPRKLRRRARHLGGLAVSPVYIRPGPNMVPIWEVREPLQTFPSPGDPDDLVPDNCIFAFRRTYGYLKKTYAEEMTRFPVGRDGPPPDDTLIDVLQYCDDQEFVMLAVASAGDNDPYGVHSPTAEQAPAVRLQRAPNPTGRPTVVVPGRISMARMAGQFDQLIGMYEQQGYVWAMHLQALKRSIFQETWLVGRPNEQPSITAPADPFTGEVGVVEGGVLQDFRTDANVQTLQTLSLMERNQRLTGDVPAEFGGESPSNVRTARRGAQVLSSAVDFPVQEAQEILADSLMEENLIAIEIAKAYWPSTSKTLIVPFSDLPVRYTPEETFRDDNAHMVTYSYAGTDTGGLVVEAGQRKGLGTLSSESFMEIDPMVRDVGREKNRIEAEAIELAQMASIQQQASQPDSPYTPVDLAQMIKYVREDGLALYEAVVKIQAEIQARQAQAAQNQLPPEQMQPGLAPAGAPGTPQSAVPAGGVPGPSPDQQKLGQLMSTLFAGGRGVNLPQGQ